MSDELQELPDTDAWGPTAQEAAEALCSVFSAFPTTAEVAESLRAARKILDEEPQP